MLTRNTTIIWKFESFQGAPNCFKGARSSFWSLVNNIENMMKKMKIIKMVFGIFLGSFKFLVLKFLKFYFRCAQISVTKLVSAQNFYYLFIWNSLILWRHKTNEVNNSKQQTIRLEVDTLVIKLTWRCLNCDQADS